MWEEVNRLGETSGLMKIKQTEFYDGEEKHLKILEEHPDVSPSSVIPLNSPLTVSPSLLSMIPHRSRIGQLIRYHSRRSL